MGPKLVIAEKLGHYLKRLELELPGHKVGSSSFSTVFEHPADRDLVVKITYRDPAYLEFVRWCQRSDGNPWVPRIVQVEELELEDVSHVWAVTCPHLEPADPKVVDRVFKQQIAPWTQGQVFSPRTRLSFPEWRNVLRMTQDPDLRALTAFLLRNFNRLDLMDRNFMMRGRQLVFNDPLSPIV